MSTSLLALILRPVLKIAGLIVANFIVLLTRYFSTLAPKFGRKKTPLSMGKKMIFDGVTES